MDIHIKAVHEVLHDQFHCSVCFKGIKYSNSLRKHERTHLKSLISLKSGFNPKQKSEIIT